ncbi:conserved exported hypothetical protein [Agrobacterium tomkonis CFBP 6623]|uniref:Uncharacterized protein n=2 Tax=Rhizobiaceae TaxID=82115 RepID=A0A1S7RLV6_9HYPH|nr:conserved exported hypothetical protein [Agrobacterium tomkonis CFBP 6623]
MPFRTFLSSFSTGRAVMNFATARWPVRLANGLVVEIVPIFSVTPVHLPHAATTEGKNQALLTGDSAVLSLP